MDVNVREYAESRAGAVTSGHVWRTRSKHLTSEGLVSYQRCLCGAWRVFVTPGRELAGPDVVGGADRGT
jgi:hypothetical protein